MVRCRSEARPFYPSLDRKGHVKEYKGRTYIVNPSGPWFSTSQRYLFAQVALGREADMGQLWELNPLAGGVARVASSAEDGALNCIDRTSSR